MTVLIVLALAAFVGLAGGLVGWFAAFHYAFRHPEYQGDHRWGDWSKPYPVAGRSEKWQQRTCQCGNRDWRPAP